MSLSTTGYAFQRGECERGDSCRFSHAAEGEYSAPAPREAREAKPSGICYAFNRGECERGDSCRFSHEAGEVPERSAGGRGVCYAFQRGECERGDSCRFSHVAAEPSYA